MKIDRQLGIITTLLQKEKITAPELAKKFEVSRRTILRDIDDICKAGIPVITWQGGDGGISIADGYKLDKSVLTVDELSSIVAGLVGIGSVTDSPRIERLISKLAPKKEGVVSIRENILIDLSSHYKISLSEKINLIKRAIFENKLTCFEYYSAKGIEKRVVEPCFITFKWSAWYLFGFCRDKCDFRLFKLNRLWKLQVLDETFVLREIPSDEPDRNDTFPDTYKITILFDKAAEFLLVDEYGPDSYVKEPDGRLKLTVGFTNKDFMIRWILGFGEQATVLEPAELVKEIESTIKKMSKNYERDI